MKNTISIIRREDNYYLSKDKLVDGIEVSDTLNIESYVHNQLHTLGDVSGDTQEDFLEKLGVILITNICELKKLNLSEELMKFQDAIGDYFEEDYSDIEYIEGLLEDTNNIKQFLIDSDMNEVFKHSNILIAFQDGHYEILPFIKLFDVLMFTQTPKGIYYIETI